MSARTLSPTRGRQGLPRVTILSVLLTAGLWLALGPAPAPLVFDRAAIAGGEGWRLITGHLVHCDGRHALWDIGALALIGWLLENQGRGRMALAAGAGILAVDAALWWGMPELERYCGLSGMLNALFVVALADLWWLHRHPIFPLTALLLGLKLVVEIKAGQTVLVDTLWPGVPPAHVAGCLGGLLVLTLARLANSDHSGSGESR